MLVYESKDYNQVSTIPNENFDPENPTVLFVVDETTDEGKDLAAKIKAHSPYYDFVTNEAGELVDINPMPSIPYMKSKEGPILIGEVLTITSGVTPVNVYTEGQEFLETDGVIEYSNQNPGTHYISLRAEGYKPVFVEVVVNAG